jgi:hypothetical protein
VPFRVAKTFHLDVSEEKTSITADETEFKNNFPFTFQLCKDEIPTDERACDSQTGLNNRAECGGGIQVWG